MVCLTGLQHSHVRLYFISGTIIVNLTISKYNANVFIKQTTNNSKTCSSPDVP